MRALVRLITPLLIVALFLSACGGAVLPQASDVTDSGFRFYLGLPRMVIDFDADGQPSIGDLTAADIEAIAGMAPGSLALDASVIGQLAAGDIQHLELVHTGNGILLFANGKLLPTLVWDGDSFHNIGQVATMFGVPLTRLIDLLAPIVDRTGVNAVLRFPSSGAEIPLRDPAVEPVVTPDAADDVAAVVTLDVDFDSEGVPTIAGATTREFGQAIGFDLSMLELPPDLLATLLAGGVEELRLQTEDEGLFVSVNGMALPHVGWSTDQLAAGAEVYSGFAPMDAYAKLARIILPRLDNADIDLLLRFQTE